MKNTDIPRIREWFKEYTNTFLGSDEAFDNNIRLKVEHSYRVLERMDEIADSMGLTGRRRRIALACALLHDCGRFEQLKKYGTFADIRSVNHGEIGAEIIRKHDVLSALSAPARDVIMTAVRYHNVKTVPPELNAEQRFFTELTRDADKVDIFKVIGDYYADPDPRKDRTLVHDLAESPDICDEVFNEFMHNGHVSFINMKTVTDFMVFQIGWIWDINNRAALDRLLDLGYVERIIAAMPETGRTAEVIAKFRDFTGRLAGEKKLGWTELSRTKMHDCNIFRLYSSQRSSSDGKIATAYMIDAPNWVTVIPLLKKDGRDYFVMVRQYRHGSMKITTEFPAGTLEPNEEPEQAAARELQEETGYKAGKLTWLGTVNPNPAFLNNNFTAFLAEDLVPTGMQNLDEHEYVDYELVPADEVIMKMGSGEYSNGTMMIALMYYLREKGMNYGK